MRSRFNTAAVPTTQLRKRLSNGIRKQTDTGVYLTTFNKKNRDVAWQSL
jgi:hypothetical protein